MCTDSKHKNSSRTFRLALNNKRQESGVDVCLSAPVFSLSQALRSGGGGRKPTHPAASNASPQQLPNNPPRQQWIEESRLFSGISWLFKAQTFGSWLVSHWGIAEFLRKFVITIQHCAIVLFLLFTSTRGSSGKPQQSTIQHFIFSEPV